MLGVNDVEDTAEYDDGVEYDDYRRISTDGEGRDLLSRWQKMREEKKMEELSAATVESTSTVKFKEGAFEHVSEKVMAEIMALQFVLSCCVCVCGAPPTPVSFYSNLFQLSPTHSALSF
jgi:hypothetical protein